VLLAVPNLVPKKEERPCFSILNMYRYLGIREALTAPQTLLQNASVERLIGSIRRECLDHMIVVNAYGLQRVLKSYFEYYDHTRTYLAS